MKKILTFCTLIFAFAVSITFTSLSLTGCGKGGGGGGTDEGGGGGVSGNIGGSGTDTYGSPTSGEVIMAGQVKPKLKDAVSVACYWRGNGHRINLHTASDSEARAVAVANNTIYTAGWYKSGSVTKACYWTGTTKTDLHAGTESQAYSIAVDGTDVYVAGYWKDNDIQKACYWKNGVKIDLNTVSNSRATAIAVSGGTVYAAGTYYAELFPGYYLTPTFSYWTDSGGNVTRTLVASDVILMAETIAMAVSGGTVYTAGTYGIGNSSYWTGSTETQLWSETNSNLNGICLSGGNVYTTGKYMVSSDDDKLPYWMACYWTNTTRTDLPLSNSLYVEAYAIAVSGSDIYVAGRHYESGSITVLPHYWKNGTLTQTLDNAYIDHGSPYAIVVAP